MIFLLLAACGGAPNSTTDALGDTATDGLDTGTEANASYDIPAFPEGVSTLAGSGEMAIADGTGPGASFMEPKAIALASDGLLYVAGSGGELRTVDMDGVVDTISLGLDVDVIDGSQRRLVRGQAEREQPPAPQEDDVIADPLDDVALVDAGFLVIGYRGCFP